MLDNGIAVSNIEMTSGNYDEDKNLIENKVPVITTDFCEIGAYGNTCYFTVIIESRSFNRDLFEGLKQQPGLHIYGYKSFIDDFYNDDMSDINYDDLRDRINSETYCQLQFNINIDKNDVAKVMKRYAEIRSVFDRSGTRVVNQLLRQVSLLFLVGGDNILLAMKKRGFGQGHWNGVGGKRETGETIEQTAIRECQEEINVIPTDIKHVATLDFHFPPDKSDWDMQAYVYLCSTWQGEPTETEEMKPKWYKFADVPYDKMWTDDNYWLPQVLDGKFVTAKFIFDSNDNVKDYIINV